MMDNLAVEAGENKDYVGYLLWYSVSNEIFNRTTMDKKLQGFPNSVLPEPARKIDAIKYAFRKFENKNIVLSKDDSTHTEYRALIRRADKKYFVLFIERINTDTQEIMYHEKTVIFKITHTRKKNDADFEVNFVSDYRKDLSITVVNKIRETTSAVYNNYIPVDIRELFYKTINYTNGFKMRNSGAIYFVDIKYKEYIEKLESLNEVDGIEFTSFPVVRTSRYVNKVLDNLYDSVAGDIKALKLEIENMPPDTPPSKIARKLKDINHLRDILKHYHESLNAQVDMYESLLGELSKKIVSE